jgi:hypothetical protein
MKKNLFIIPSLILCLISFHFSCQKIGTNGHTNPSEKEVLKFKHSINWLNDTKKGQNKNAQELIEELKSNLDETVKIETINEGKSLIIIQIGNKYKTQNITPHKTIKSLVLVEQYDKIISGGVIEIIRSNGEAKPLPNDFISKIYRNEIEDFEGIVSVFSVFKTYKGDFVCKQGAMPKVRIPKINKPNGHSGWRMYNSTIPSTRVDECTDWYWEYYVNGVLVFEEFAFRTCNGEMPCRVFTNINSLNQNQVTECSGGGGSNIIYEQGTNDADDGRLSCKSFKFTQLTTNMYEAGIRGLQFVIDVVPPIVHTYRPAYIGFPKTTADGRTFTPEAAAQKTADIMNRVGLAMTIKYFNNPAALTVTTASLEIEFKTLVQGFLSAEIGAGATVSFIQSGNNTITRDAVWNSSWDQFWNGLTGSGCQNP